MCPFSCISGLTGLVELVANLFVKLDVKQFLRRVFELGSRSVSFSELGVFESISCFCVEFMFGWSFMELDLSKFGFSYFLFNLFWKSAKTCPGYVM